MTLSYDGHDLESLFICGEPQISIMNAQPEIADVSARNGFAFVGFKYGESTVSFTIAATGSAAERRGKFSTLGSWLMVDSPKKLILPDTPDRYYSAVARGSLDLQRAIDAEYTTITFALDDPVAVSNTESTKTTTSNLATFTVGGTAPTYLTVETSSAHTTASNQFWGVATANSWTGPNMSVAVGYSVSNASVKLDAENRTALVNGEKKLLAISSEWLSVEPGENNIYRTNGTGGFTVKWRDRWY